MNIKTLTDFKRYLFNGGIIQLISVYGEEPAEKVKHPRKVEKMQTNACKFEGGSWLYFPKADKFMVNGDTVIIDGLIYKLIDNI